MGRMAEAEALLDRCEAAFGQEHEEQDRHIGLVTQVTPAKTFGTDLAPYPRVMRVYESCMAIPAFADAQPAKQPDAE